MKQLVKVGRIPNRITHSFQTCIHNTLAIDFRSKTSSWCIVYRDRPTSYFRSTNHVPFLYQYNAIILMNFQAISVNPVKKINGGNTRAIIINCLVSSKHQTPFGTNCNIRVSVTWPRIQDHSHQLKHRPSYSLPLDGISTSVAGEGKRDHRPSS